MEFTRQNVRAYFYPLLCIFTPRKVTRQRKMLSYFGYMEKLNSFVVNHLLYGQKENISMERHMCKQQMLCLGLK